MKFLILILFSLNSLAVSFSSLPEDVRAFQQRAHLPTPLSVIWNQANGNSDLSVHVLTDQMKQQHVFRSSLQGFAQTRDRNFQILERGTDTHFNLELGLAAESLKRQQPELFQSNHTIFIPDNSLSSNRHNIILILFHELSHIYLTEYLNKHIHKMVGAVPTDFVSKNPVDGKTIIDSEFLSYLQERFAHECEFQLFIELKKTREFLPVIPPKWMGMQNYTFTSAAKKQIAVNVRTSYKLNDVRFAMLDSKDVFEIINGN